MIREEEITISSCSYEIGDIQWYFQSVLVKKRIEIHIENNNNTLRSEIFYNRETNFMKEDSIGPLLKFEPQILEVHKSTQDTKNHSLALNLNGLWGVLNYVSVTGISALTDWKPIFPIENNVFKVNNRLQYNSYSVFIVFLLFRMTL